MKKIKLALSIALLTTIIATSCKNKPTTNCLPAFIHTALSDSLAAHSHNISYSEAKGMIARFKNSHKDSIDIPNYGVFNRDAMYDLINIDSVVGVAVFNGLTASNKMKHILIPVKAGGGLDTIHCKEKSLGEPTIVLQTLDSI